MGEQRQLRTLPGTQLLLPAPTAAKPGGGEPPTHSRPCCSHETSDSLIPPGHIEHFIHMDDPANLRRESRTLSASEKTALSPERLPDRMEQEANPLHVMRIL